MFMLRHDHTQTAVDEYMLAIDWKLKVKIGDTESVAAENTYRYNVSFGTVDLLLYKSQPDERNSPQFLSKSEIKLVLTYRRYECRCECIVRKSK